jgi:hypothetical protein
MASDHRLLILSCSQRKRPDAILLPALERYDGPMFRVLRKFLRENPSKELHPDVYILSAQFGLISADQLIPIPDFCKRSISHGLWFYYRFTLSRTYAGVENRKNKGIESP